MTPNRTLTLEDFYQRVEQHKQSGGSDTLQFVIKLLRQLEPLSLAAAAVIQEYTADRFGLPVRTFHRAAEVLAASGTATFSREDLTTATTAAALADLDPDRRIMQRKIEQEAINRWLRHDKHKGAVLVDVDPDLARWVVADWAYSRAEQVDGSPEPPRGRRGCSWILSQQEQQKFLRDWLAARADRSAEITGAYVADRTHWPIVEWSSGQPDGDRWLWDWWPYGGATNPAYCARAAKVAERYNRGRFGVFPVCDELGAPQVIDEGKVSLEGWRPPCELLSGSRCGYWGQQKRMRGFKCKVFGVASLRGEYAYKSGTMFIDADELPPDSDAVGLQQLQSLAGAGLPEPWAAVFALLTKYVQSHKRGRRGAVVTRLAADIPGLADHLTGERVEHWLECADDLPEPNRIIRALRGDWLRIKDDPTVRPRVWIRIRDGVPGLMIPSRPLIRARTASCRYALTTRAHPYFRRKLEKLGYTFITPAQVIQDLDDEDERKRQLNRKSKITREDAHRAAKQLDTQGQTVSPSALARVLAVATSTMTRALRSWNMTAGALLTPTFDEVRSELETGPVVEPAEAEHDAERTTTAPESTDGNVEGSSAS
jgi:hypothetical protein